jgi:hypothetical protein
MAHELVLAAGLRRLAHEGAFGPQRVGQAGVRGAGSALDGGQFQGQADREDVGDVGRAGSRIRNP